MTPESVVSIAQHALWIAFLVSAPMLLGGLATGLLVSIFQAATQINEMTLTFIPKLLVTFAIVVLAGPWMIQELVDYTVQLFRSIPGMVG
ncbi:MAG: flagellar biosynthesis protein FliQ [Betaproteobacteria bacterium]|nr:flagellar biosynthesis protein FliQ [Betaproteobacteria bacterium]